MVAVAVGIIEQIRQKRKFTEFYCATIVVFRITLLTTTWGQLKQK